MNDTVTTASSPETLRAAMVDQVKEAGHARSRPPGRGGDAAVPRHQFVPAAPVQEAYDDLP